MNFILDFFIVLASLVVLYFAYFKKSELGKLSIYVIFASMLLQSLFSSMMTVSFFDFLDKIYGTLGTFVIYGEIILLVLLVLTRLKKASNKYFKISLIFLIVVKFIAVLGLF